MSPPTTQVNRRHAPRQKAALPAILVTLDNGMSLDCVIKDISETGARLAIPPSRQIPELFFVIDVRARMAHRAKLAWRTKQEIGVHYQDTMALTAGLDPSLRFLNRSWLERAARL